MKHNMRETKKSGWMEDPMGATVEGEIFCKEQSVDKGQA